ncbi:protein LKAAEAR1-like isoform X2 [Alosa alosa]|nr:protein LKAAEAR1-like isoform X2 [Alosa sapidissima]XP_048097034.1 protein LKAAEAR1-like isoform X2 [Alosa alosa]
MASNTGLDRRKNQRSSNEMDLNKMCPQQRARCQAYMEPSKEAQRWTALAKQRVCATINVTKEKGLQDSNSRRPSDNKTRQDALVGQLKAAEARNRIRQKRLNYHNYRAQEINLMISSQATAQRALRVELLLPTSKSKMKTNDSLDKLQRRRVEEILDDERELTLSRA